MTSSCGDKPDGVGDHIPQHFLLPCCPQHFCQICRVKTSCNSFCHLFSGSVSATFSVNHSCSYQMSHFLCIDHRVVKIRRVTYRSQCGCLTKIQCIYCRYLPHIFLNPSSKIYKKFSCVKKEAFLVYFQESC